MSGILECPPPGDLPDLGIKLMSQSPALAGRFFTTSTTWEAQVDGYEIKYLSAPAQEKLCTMDVLN